MPLSLHSHSKRIECGFHLSRVSHYLFIYRIGWITMGKWIDERAWTVAMYICYILSFIILSVAGYNYILSVIGDTTSFMKVILFVCVCLFVAMVVALVFAAFITPFSELLKRFLDFLFFRKTNMIIPQDSEDIEEIADNDDADMETNSDADNSNGNTEGSNVSDSVNPQREALKKEFIEKYVKGECQSLPIYEVFESLFNQHQSGAFAARALQYALNDPNWLKDYPGYEDAKRLFPQPGAINGTKSNYSNSNNNRNYSNKTIEATKSLLKDKLKELTATLEKQES